MRMSPSEPQGNLYAFTHDEIYAGIASESINARLLGSILKRNDTEFQKIFADMRCHPGQPSADGVTPLMVALMHGTPAMVKTLQGHLLSNINQQTISGITALHIAAAQRTEYCLSLRHFGADITLQDSSGKTALDLLHDPNLKKELQKPPRCVFLTQRPHQKHNALPPSLQPAFNQKASRSIDVPRAEEAIIKNNPHALQHHLNNLVITVPELNRYLELSLKTADQPVIVHMLLTAGANPNDWHSDGQKKIYQAALRHARPHALQEILRKKHVSISKIDAIENLTHLFHVERLPDRAQDMQKCLRILELRESHAHLYGMNAKSLASELTHAVKFKNADKIISIFAESQKKRFFSTSIKFDPAIAAAALSIVIAEGHFLAAHDMADSGKFNLWDSPHCKNMPEFLEEKDMSHQNIQKFMSGSERPPRVLTPEERIREIRALSGMSPRPYGFGLGH